MADPLDTEESTIDDTIRNTLRDLNEREAAGDEITGVRPVVAEGDPAPTLKNIDRARDETGKFTKAEKAAAAAEPGAASSQEQAAGAEQQAAGAEAPLVTTTGQQIDLNRAPASWKPAAKAIWATLPEPARAEVYRREGDYLNGNKGVRENADFGQTIKATIEPYRMLIEAEGGTPERAIADTLRTAALFRVGTTQQKQAAMLALDRQFNVGLVAAMEQEITARLQGQQQGQQPQQFAQPWQQPQQFQDPRIDQIMASMQAQERARAQEQEQVSNAATERFIGAKDEKGQPLYPFVDNVLDDMALRVQHLRKANPSMNHEEVLKEAYTAAAWANPETRAVLIGQQQAQQQTNEETLRKSEAAKRASRLNMPKRGSLPAGEAQGTMDDTIRDTLRQLTG